MKSDFYAAYVFEGRTYCTDCLPPGSEPEATPIFADAEFDSYPVCDVCGEQHDYVRLIGS